MAKNATKGTGRRGRPPLSAAEKKRRLELKKQGKAPKRTRRARSEFDPAPLHVSAGWWGLLTSTPTHALISNGTELRLVDLEAGTMKRIEQPDASVATPTSQMPVISEAEYGEDADEGFEIPLELRRDKEAA
jgi:hypothetical protein